jgi:GNAT superfamily N-acetyltransferase
MSLSADAVIAASNAWTWIPDFAETVETDEYLIVRFPDYFDHPLEVMRFTPRRPLEPAVAGVLARAREFGRPEVHWMIRLDSPPGVAELLAGLGGKVDETLDVLALDVSHGGPELPAPSRAVDVRWATDIETVRDGARVDVAVFGGSMPPDDRLAATAEQNSIPGADGSTLVAYIDGTPVGAGGVTLADGVARLWGGGVLESARGQGVYRAVLGARLDFAVARGASMALVKGRVETSGPILRRAGFAVYGQELIYQVPLG